MIGPELEDDEGTHTVLRFIFYSSLVLLGASNVALGLWTGNAVQWSGGAVVMALGLFFLGPMFVHDPHAVD